MSRKYETRVTVTVEGVEADYPVRAWVTTAPGLAHGGGFGAELDGAAQVYLPEGWFDVEALELEARDAERIEEALCDLALEDDESECIEWGDGFQEVYS